jgi:class 3 adenylate cyclase/TolB-like protein
MARDQRRLAAIVSADVAGYSRLMGRDDSGTLAALKAHRRKLIDPKIAEYGGRIVKTTGDGLLLEFPSVVDAVRCSVDVQRGMAERNAEVLPEDRIEFRIGINVGDIIIDGEDIFGDGVNVAARLQAVADPGSICVSKVVRDQVLDKLSFTFEDLGAQQVKNIARPVEIFRVEFDAAAMRAAKRRVWRPLQSVSAQWLVGGAIALLLVGMALWSISDVWNTPRLPAAPPLSVAILPFGTPSGGAAEKQLADAFTGELTSSFERAARLAKVTSSSVAAQYRDKAGNPGALGRQLNVRYLVEGDVRHVGDEHAIDAKLIDAGTGTQVWNDSLRLDASALKERSPIAVQRFARRLSDALWAAELARSRATPPKGASAMEFVLHGWAVWLRDDNTVRGALEARKWFDRALEHDPDSVPALLARTRTLGYELDFDPRVDRDLVVAQVDRSTFHAVAIDPSYSGAWSTRAWTLMLQWRWDAALEAIAKAEKLDPTNSAVLNVRETIMVLTGQPAAALELTDEQLARDPQQKDPVGWAWFQRCRAHVALGRYDDAIASCEANIAIDNWWLPHAYLLAAYAQKGETSKAATEKAVLLGLRRGFSIADFKAQRFSDNAAFWQQTEAHLFAGLRKADIPEQ